MVLDAVGTQRGFRTIKYLDEQPFLDEFAASDLGGMTIRKFRRHPEGILRMALARADTLEWSGDDVISFEDSQRTRVRLYFDPRTHLLAKVQRRNWRKLSFDEVRRFLVFLFGENPFKTDDGITVTKDKGRWRISFKGRVGFYHDVVDGRTISHAAKAEAARHNKAAVDLVSGMSSLIRNGWSWRRRIEK